LFFIPYIYEALFNGVIAGGNSLDIACISGMLFKISVSISKKVSSSAVAYYFF
jgi:hypothetical protein